MRYTIFLNFVGLLAGIFACLSITHSNYDLLQLASLARAELRPTPEDFYEKAVMLNLGLQAVAVENPNTNTQEIVRFDQFCDVLGLGLDKYLQEPIERTCQKCADVQPHMVIGLIVAVVFFVPAMAANCSRMHLTTDVNFFKFWATFVECVSLAGLVLCWYQFTFNCLRPVFHDGNVGFTRGGLIAEVDSIAEVVRVNFDWSVGYGMLCLYAAFGLKVIDFVSNCCLPTPAITRNTYDQKIYETKVQEILDGKRDPEGGDLLLEKDDSFSEESVQSDDGT